MKKDMKYRPYHCIRCDYHFDIKTDGTYAPACIKCRDSEYINNGYKLPEEISLPEIKLEERPKDSDDDRLELMPDNADRHTWPYI